MMAGTVKLNPIASIDDTTNTSMDTWTMTLSASILLFLITGAL
jgi:hypothetical protein